MTRRPFHCTCVGWPHDVDLLIYLQDRGVEIPRERFLDLVEPAAMLDVETGLGYTRSKKNGLRMAQDYHVRYFVDPDIGLPYFVHSATEYVFAWPEDIDDLQVIFLENIEKEMEEAVEP